MRNKLFRFLTAALVLYSFGSATMAQTEAFDTSRMDTSADACDDFLPFANGTWVKNTPIPPSQSRWGSFNILAESNRDVEHDILEKAAKQPNATGDIKLIGDFYASCMDEAAIEKAGAHPLDAEFARINNIKIGQRPQARDRPSFTKKAIRRLSVSAAGPTSETATPSSSTPDRAV